MDPLRIVFVSHTADRSGAPTCLLRLVQRLDRQQFTPAAVVGEDGPLVRALRAAGVSVHVFTKYRSRGPGGLVRATALLKQLHPDVVHVNRAVGLSKTFALGARLLRMPVVWHLHDEVHNHRLRRRMPWVLRLSTSIVSCSSEVLRQEGLETRGRLIQNGVDFAVPDRARLLRQARRLGVPEVPFRFLFVGTVIPRKNVHLLLEAARQVLATHPETAFSIVGGGNDPGYRRKIQAEVGGDPLLSRCWEDYREHSDVAPFYAASDCLVLPSQSEAMPLVILEAAAHGVPTIASDVGDVAQLVTEDTGWLLRREELAVDPLARVLVEVRARGAEATRAVGERATRRLGRQYSLDRFAQRFAQLYVELAPRAAPRPATSTIVAKSP